MFNSLVNETYSFILVVKVKMLKYVLLNLFSQNTFASHSIATPRLMYNLFTRLLEPHNTNDTSSQLYRQHYINLKNTILLFQFQSKYSLNKHERVAHSGNAKRYPCTTCGQTFAKKTW